MRAVTAESWTHQHLTSRVRLPRCPRSPVLRDITAAVVEVLRGPVVVGADGVHTGQLTYSSSRRASGGTEGEAQPPFSRRQLCIPAPGLAFAGTVAVTREWNGYRHPRLVVGASCRGCGWHTGFMEHNATGDVRVWAKSHGFQVGDRGRLPTAVVEAYRLAGEMDAATASGDRPTRKATAGKRRRAAPAAGVTLAEVSPSGPSVRASRGATDLSKRPASVVKPPTLARVVDRVDELEAQVAALTERLDAVATGAKPSRGFSLPRLR